jgi:methionyl-tRNA formyltransferase
LSEKILHTADQNNREKIQRQNTDINLKWTNTINSTDNQIESLSHIVQCWTNFDRDIIVIQKSLAGLSEKVKDIEVGQKTQALLEDKKNNILVRVDLKTFNILMTNFQLEF